VRALTTPRRSAIPVDFLRAAVRNAEEHPDDAAWLEKGEAPVRSPHSQDSTVSNLGRSTVPPAALGKAPKIVRGGRRG
jgi:hypothetical protein